MEGPQVPSQVRYQTALRPVKVTQLILLPSTHNTNFFLLNAEGTNLYASFLSIFVMYLVAIRSPQLGQNIAP